MGYLLVIVIIFFLNCTFSRDIYTGLVNKQVERNIDLTSSIARHSVELTIENSGQTSTQHVYLTLQSEFGAKLSLLNVTQRDKILEAKKEETTLDYVPYRIILKSPLTQGDRTEIKIEMVFVHTMKPFPSEITQSERQLVRYNDNHYWYSPYKTESVRTKIKLSSSSVQSNSELSPSSVKADLVTYGPYKDVGSFSYSPLSLHFENNRPFITIKNVLRWVEVSHWGNIAIEEQYKIVHDGALLKGSFSRYDFQINPQANGQSAVQILKQYLPEVATDVYYRDDIGNISTSALRSESPKQTFEMRPRFPLFGGWKTEFTMGYNLPTAPYLGTSASGYVLRIPFIADWDYGVTIDRQVLKVILPEGSSFIEVKAPFDVEVSQENLVTYLDVALVGRPVIVITKNNIVNDHYHDIFIVYSFSKSMILFEPLQLILGFFFLFLITILILRVELNISDGSKTRIDDPECIKILEKVSEIYSQRSTLHTVLTNDFNNYIKSNDEKTWEKEKKSKINQFNDYRKKVYDLTRNHPELFSKINEIEKKQNDKETLQHQLNDLFIKFKVKKTISKDDYETEYTKITENYETLDNEIDEDLEELLSAS